MKEALQEEKITQAAAYLVQKRGQGFMSYMKLVKLLYLADRESLLLASQAPHWNEPEAKKYIIND